MIEYVRFDAVRDLALPRVRGTVEMYAHEGVGGPAVCDRRPRRQIEILVRFAGEPDVDAVFAKQASCFKGDHESELFFGDEGATASVSADGSHVHPTMPRVEHDAKLPRSCLDVYRCSKKREEKPKPSHS